MTTSHILPAPDAHLGYWLRVVSNGVSQRFARELDSEGVTVAEWMALRVLLEAGEMLPSVLADRLRLTRGAISKLTDRLVGKGLVVRTPAASDGRSHRLELTEAGRKLTPRLVTLADRNDAAFFDFLPAADRETLRRVLEAIVDRGGIADVPLD